MFYTNFKLFTFVHYSMNFFKDFIAIRTMCNFRFKVERIFKSLKRAYCITLTFKIAKILLFKYLSKTILFASSSSILALKLWLLIGILDQCCMMVLKTFSDFFEILFSQLGDFCFGFQISDCLRFYELLLLYLNLPKTFNFPVLPLISFLSLTYPEKLKVDQFIHFINFSPVSDELPFDKFLFRVAIF